MAVVSNRSAEYLIPEWDSLPEYPDQSVKVKHLHAQLIEQLSSGFSAVFAALYRMNLLHSPSFSFEPNFTSQQEMWDVRVKQFGGLLDINEMRDLADYRVVDRLCRKPSYTIIDLLTEAEAMLNSSQSYLSTLRNNKNAARCIYGLPLHGRSLRFLEQYWQEEIMRLFRVIVEMKLRITTLKSVTEDTPSGVNILPGRSVTVTLPTTAERLAKGKDGKPRGHRFWIVPTVQVSETTPRTNS